MPTQGGGLGIRRIEDISDAFAIKAWWLLKSANSLWAIFMRNKYAKQLNNNARICYGSATWKRMYKVKFVANAQISWVIGEGNVNFSNDKWFEDTRITETAPPPPALNALSVKQVLRNENNALALC